MYKFVKKGAFMLLVASLAMSMASCDDDDAGAPQVMSTHMPTCNEYGKL